MSVIGVTRKPVIRDRETYRYTYLWTILSTNRHRLRAGTPDNVSGTLASPGWTIRV
jgi:hypothetical protein